MPSAVKSSHNCHDSLMHQLMMLRFRPIAPKPAAKQPVSAAVKIIGTRRKRKYVRVCGRRKTKNAAKTDRKVVSPSPPEKSRVEDNEPSLEKKGEAVFQMIRSECENSTVGNIAGAGDGDDKVMNIKEDTGFGATVAPETFHRSVIKTWITVECVTDTLADSGVGLGVSDWEKINRLSMDTCPGFISDGAEKVLWVNEAYRKMVRDENKGNINMNIMVWLGVKEELIPRNRGEFACRVRMGMETKQGYKWNRILACDVWRMEFGGFAWKLDISTALGLSI